MPGPRVNDFIRVPEVRVIGPDGIMLGVLRTDEARRMAREADLDLVEVDPKANPPVCKIMDLSRFKYEEVKKRAEARKRQTRDDGDPGTKG
jgi:translation initiation factor IF-3